MQGASWNREAGGGPAAAGVLTFPFATALHLNLWLASARSRASCSSLAKVQCRFWLLLWYILKSETRPTYSGEKDRKRHNTAVKTGHDSRGVRPPGAGALTS